MTRARRAGTKPAGGAAMVELAVLFPALLLMLAGTMDFARAFYTGMAASSAARAGVQYGSRSISASTDYAGMERAALEDARSIGGLRAEAGRFCACGNGPAVSCTVGCSIPGELRIYVQVDTEARFQTLGRYPGVPSPVTVRGRAVMRVQ